ncbi:MAG: RlmE family RNA methyltransferase [Methanobacteriota archaeon]
MGKRWKQERKKEQFYRMAKSEGYRSRASFKLKQLSKRYGLLRRGNVVVDLGAAPGGWLQVAMEEVGGAGFVLGVDIQRISKFPGKKVVTIVADITKPETRELIKAGIPRSADIVISDASPSISGVWDIDHARSIELVTAALEVADDILALGGKFLVKVFQGEMFNDFLKEVRQRFEFVKVSKPMASRKGSAEVYVIGKGFKRT